MLYIFNTTKAGKLNHINKELFSENYWAPVQFIAFLTRCPLRRDNGTYLYIQPAFIDQHTCRDIQKEQ